MASELLIKDGLEVPLILNWKTSIFHCCAILFSHILMMSPLRPTEVSAICKFLLENQRLGMSGRFQSPQKGVSPYITKNIVKPHLWWLKSIVNSFWMTGGFTTAKRWGILPSKPWKLPTKTWETCATRWLFIPSCWMGEHPSWIWLVYRVIYCQSHHIYMVHKYHC